MTDAQRLRRERDFLLGELESLSFHAGSRVYGEDDTCEADLDSVLARFHEKKTLWHAVQRSEQDLHGFKQRERARVSIEAKALVLRAEHSGLILTIEQTPLQPLAMGNLESMITVRPARGHY